MKDLLFSVFPNENFIDLSLYQFGWERCKPSHAFGPAARTHYLFHYVISGTGILHADDSEGTTRTYSVKSGQGFMIFPNQINMYMNSPIYHANSHILREEMMNEMLYIAQHGDMSPFHLIGHMYLVLDAMTRSISSIRLKKGGRLRDFYIHESINFIEQNFHNDISVEDIADHCGLNRSYFGKIFKESIGRTPQEFLLNYRMTKASELLKLTKLSIGVGYDNPLHFSRAFKNVYGVSPRIWRNDNLYSG